MKLYLLTFIVFFLGSSQSLLAQNDLAIVEQKRNYISAKQEIEAMLEGQKPLSYERAIYIIENAWWDNTMTFQNFKEIITRDTSIIRTIATQQEVKSEQSASNFWEALREENIKDKNYQENALINASIFSYLTDTLYFVDSNRLLYHLPFSYTNDDPFGSTDWRNTQVSYLLGKGKGNCFALVSLFKILSERFNSNANICTAPGHTYICHKDNKGIKYNIEVSSKAFPGTGTLSTLTHTTKDAIINDISLRELNLKQSVALCLVYLAKGYEHKFHTTIDDGFMMDCANTALKFDSLNLNAMLLKAEIFEKQVLQQNKTIAQLQTDNTFKGYQKLISNLFTLGYREMPLRMKNMLIRGWMRDTTSQLATINYHTTNKNDANSNVATRKASLSWGMFDEEITDKPMEKYGRTVYDTRRKKIVAFAKEEVLYNNYNFDPVVFAFNVDPMAHKYPHASPYNFVENNPISRIDPDGDDWILSTGNKIYWYGGKVGDKKNLLTVFKATSGMDKAIKTTPLPGGGVKKETVNVQRAKYQKYPDVGPTPEGRYKINLKPDPNRVAEADKSGALKRNPQGGIEKIPNFVENPAHPGYGWTYEAWGENRARLEPVNVTGASSTDRDLYSFYFHDSKKGYSHGCTECETGLFDKLKEYREAGNESIDVIIQYPSAEHKTNGGTKTTETTKTTTDGH